MRMPMKWTVVLACLAIAVVLVERSRVMYRSSASAQVAYHTFYRDPDPAFCASPTGTTYNTSTGLRVIWAP
jgi:hypothetical protein